MRKGPNTGHRLRRTPQANPSAQGHQLLSLKRGAGLGPPIWQTTFFGFKVSKLESRAFKPNTNPLNNRDMSVGAGCGTTLLVNGPLCPMRTGTDSSPPPLPPLQLRVQGKWWLSQGMDRSDGHCQRTTTSLDQVGQTCRGSESSRWR